MKEKYQFHNDSFKQVRVKNSNPLEPVLCQTTKGVQLFHTLLFPSIYKKLEVLGLKSYATLKSHVGMTFHFTIHYSQGTIYLPCMFNIVYKVDNSSHILHAFSSKLQSS